MEYPLMRLHPLHTDFNFSSKDGFFRVFSWRVQRIRSGPGKSEITYLYFNSSVFVPVNESSPSFSIRERTLDQNKNPTEMENL